MGPGDGPGDLGQACVSRAVPGEALVQNHHMLPLPFPFANQQPARSEAVPVPGCGLTGREGLGAFRSAPGRTQFA